MGGGGRSESLTPSLWIGCCIWVKKITRKLGSSYCDPQSIKTLTISPAWSGSEGQHLGGRGESKERETIILTHKLKERFMEKHFKCIK